MITDIFVVYNSEDQIKKIKEADIPNSLFFTYINESSRKGKKEAYALKGHWGARLSPFIICMDGDKAVKAFYSESEKNVIESLINYLND